MPRFNLSTTLVFSLLLLLALSCKNTEGSDPADSDKEKPKRDVPGLQLQKRGLLVNESTATPGYVMINPNSSSHTYLLNRDAEVVHQWKGYYHSWLTYLQDDGHIIRHVVDPDAPVYYAGGVAGRLEELNWKGETIWQFEYATEAYRTHHDFAILPNGNMLIISYEGKSFEESVALGRNPEFIAQDGIWFDKIIEVKPIYPIGGEIVWEWHMIDHLVQDFDPSLANYGDPANHPELLDINASADSIPEPLHPDSLLMKKLAGESHRNSTVGSEGCDVYHSNAINYHPELDQIVFSIPHINEIFIIDHSTTIQEAAGHRGGRYGKGGDFLYRWGNPENYSRGDSTDQKLFGQHDVRWIPEGRPGAGNLTIYNNINPNGPDSMAYSSVIEIETPMDDSGNYTLAVGATYGPESPVWEFVAKDTVSLFSPFTSGAERLENGNTFILAGAAGRSLEVTPDGEIVWDYWNPYKGEIRETNGDPNDDFPFIFWQFRTTFIPVDHPALQGKDLQPLEEQPEHFDYKSVLKQRG